MSNIKQLIDQKLESLTEEKQKKVLDFVGLLTQESIESENTEWNQFSLEQAMRGLENDELPEYTEQDLIEKWQ
ncbi:MAG: hypothetical protein QNJ42_06375 [Crocosphaera sp.]|nr:hypothetical protein [Crocosphaera sp.]